MSRQFFKVALIAALLPALVGCKDDFNPRAHMTEIITNTSAAQFQGHEDYMLEHTAEPLQNHISQLIQADTLDTSYTISQLSMSIEHNKNTYRLLADYEVTTDSDAYYLVAYFTYVNNKLTNITYKRIESHVLREAHNIWT